MEYVKYKIQQVYTMHGCEKVNLSGRLFIYHFELLMGSRIKSGATTVQNVYQNDTLKENRYIFIVQVCTCNAYIKLTNV